MTRYLITGARGMDGRHLAELLIARGHRVAGLQNWQHNDVLLNPKLHLIPGDLTDQMSLVRALAEFTPDVVCNLGAVTAIGLSWGQAQKVADVTGNGVLRMLDAIRHVDPSIRLVQASSLDQFGDNGIMATEGTAPAPRTPYAAAKQFGHDMVQTYREAYGMHVSTLIFGNHSSELHGTEFVVRKVTRAAARIALGYQKKLMLGDTSVRRDWGYAPDYVKAYRLASDMLRPGDYVIATGKSRSLRSLCEMAFSSVDLDYRDFVETDTSFNRPTDVIDRSGNPDRALRQLGWAPDCGFEEMIQRMVTAEINTILNRGGIA